MNTRKDRLRSLFSGTASDGAGEGTDANPASRSATPEVLGRRSTSAAVKAMGLSLGNLSVEAQEARRLREAIASGEVVVELDAEKLERSPYTDRLSEGAHNDEDFATLLQSMKEHGQQVPVLVRPHPDKAKAARGIYQIAYGHRRVQAAKELGIHVKAVVRELTDTDLVLAQGKENAERRSLSFIERAFFAKSLIDHGFDRTTAQAALSVHKSEMSRLLQVAEMVPLDMVQAVGPAPKAGRPRWLALAALLKGDTGGLAAMEIRSEAFRAADSDARFQRLFNRLEASTRRTAGKKAKAVAQSIAAMNGKPIAELVKATKAARLTIPDSAGRGFADYVASRLPEIYRDFEQQRGGEAEE